MKKVELDIANIHTVRALHVYLAYKLNLPTYYGGNLDALYDALGDVAEPTNLVLRGAPASDEMAAYLPRLTRVLEDAAAQPELAPVVEALHGVALPALAAG